MPILHIQLHGEGQTPDGQTVQIPPQVALQQRGPVVQVSLSVAQSMAAQLQQQGLTLPPPQTGWALIDTGASGSCIDDGVAQTLGLPVVNVVQIASASHAATQQNVYPVHLDVVGAPISIDANGAIGAPLGAQGLIALIGRDVLQHMTLFYNGVNGAVTLSM